MTRPFDDSAVADGVALAAVAEGPRFIRAAQTRARWAERTIKELRVLQFSSRPQRRRKWSL